MRSNQKHATILFLSRPENIYVLPHLSSPFPQNHIYVYFTSTKREKTEEGFLTEIIIFFEEKNLFWVIPKRKGMAAEAKW